MKNDLISGRIHMRLCCSIVSTEHDMSGMLYDDCIIKVLGSKKKLEKSLSLRIDLLYHFIGLVIIINQILALIV